MTWLVGGTVLDPASGEASKQDLAIAGDRIEEVSRPGSHGQAEAIDVSGLFLIPGLIDCHVHLVMRGEDPDPSAAAGRSDEELAQVAEENARRTVLAGFTTVRDVGGWNHLEMSLRDRISRGEAIGPRLVLAGRLLSAPTPAVAYYPGMYEVVEGPDSVRRAAEAQFAAGADCIKVMATGAMLSPEGETTDPQLSREEIAAAVEVAKVHGSHVAAHAHARDGIEAAVQAGVASIEHCTFADESALRLMADRGVFLVATCSTINALRDPATRASLPAHIVPRYQEAEQIRIEMLRLAHRLGVPFATGTDAGAPGDVHGQNLSELSLLVEQSGMTPEEALRAATSGAARLLGRSEDLGVLREGAVADVVGLGADPRDDLDALVSPRLVIAAGRRLVG